MICPKPAVDLSGQACAMCRKGIIQLTMVNETIADCPETEAEGTFDIPVWGYVCDCCPMQSLTAESQQFLKDLGFA